MSQERARQYAENAPESRMSETEADSGQKWRSMRGMIRRAARALFAPYLVNRIYVMDVPTHAKPAATDGYEIHPITALEVLRDHPDPEIQRKHSYAGPGAWGYGAWVDGALVAVCWVWSDTRCRNSPVRLARDERALVDICTQSEYRGRGIAPALIACATAVAAHAGCRRLVAWIWWSNSTSIRAFEKSGWTYDSLVFSFSLFGKRIAGRWPWIARG